MGVGTPTASRWRRGVGAIVTALTVLALTPSSASADSSCEALHFCYWPDVNYTGVPKFSWTAGVEGWTSSQLDISSAKNKFNNRRVQMQTYPTGPTQCLDAGEVDPVVPAYGAFKIGNVGTHC